MKNKSSLYTFESCLSSQIVMIALNDVGIEFEQKIEKLSSQFMVEHSVRGDKPVLISSSIPYVGIYSIRDHIEKLSYNKLSLRCNPQVSKLLLMFEYDFDIEVIHILYTLKVRGIQTNISSIRDAHRNLVAYLKYIEWLASSHYFLAGKSISWVDISVFARLMGLDYFSSISWTEYPNIKEWYMKMKSMSSIMKVVNKFKVPGEIPPNHFFKLDF